jgi:dolichol-phosphate mannosyltransferase
MLAVMSILIAMIEVAIYFYEAIDVPGWASLFAAVCFIGGIQLIFLGVVGEYVGLIFDEVKNRPRYVLDRHYQSGRLTLVRDERRSTSNLINEFEGNDKRGSV